MDLIVQPADGAISLVAAIKKAKTQVEILIFRFGLKELQKALRDAVARGVRVHALIAHTNSGGGRSLRKLELDLLEAGVTVSRTDNDLVRYHGKVLLVDRAVLHVCCFNFTKLDIEKSRSVGIVTRNPRLIAEAAKLFEADARRQPYAPSNDAFIVSPQNSRASLARLIKSAKKELLIYDIKISDRQMLNLLNERAKAGVHIRILGKVAKKGHGLRVEKVPKLRLHMRAILRDGRALFIGSQSLRALELDKRREVGVIVRKQRVIRRFRKLFEEDWAETDSGKKGRKKEETQEKKVEKKVENDERELKAS